MFDSNDQRQGQNRPHESASNGPPQYNPPGSYSSGERQERSPSGEYRGENIPEERPHDASSHDASFHRPEPVPPLGEASFYHADPHADTWTPPARRKKGSCLVVGLLLGALLFLVLGGLAGWQISHQTNSATPPLGNTYKNGAMPRDQVIAQGRQAVVQINVTTPQGASLGSGVIIDQKGNIITNNHVVANGQNYQVVLFDGTTLPAKLVGTDPADDLAVVQIAPPKRIYAMPIGDSSNLRVGDDVLAIGNPLGITQTVTSGIISALGRTIPEGTGGPAVIIDAIQTDAAINPGNSGGALVNMQGQLVGIPTLVPLDPEFKTPANGVGFAIPSNRVKFIAPQLIKDGKVTHSGRPALEATVVSVDALVAAQAGLSVNSGVLVVSVASGGAAEAAGLKRGDVITQVDNSTITNTSDLTDALANRNPGDMVNLTIVRGNDHKQVRLKLGELNVSP